MLCSEALPIIRRHKQQYDREKHTRINELEASYISTAYAEILRELSRNRQSDILVTLEKMAKRMDDAACDLVFSSHYCRHLCAVIRDVIVDTYDVIQKIAIEGR